MAFFPKQITLLSLPMRAITLTLKQISIWMKRASKIFRMMIQSISRGLSTRAGVSLVPIKLKFLIPKRLTVQIFFPSTLKVNCRPQTPS